MTRLFTFSLTHKRDPDIDAWMAAQPGELGKLARTWFDVMRNCGGDVREILHDGHPTACVANAAFGYVNVFTKHVNVGFFQGAALADPAGLLEGSGKFMRHVKLGKSFPIDQNALINLIESAYQDMLQRLRSPL